MGQAGALGQQPHQYNTWWPVSTLTSAPGVFTGVRGQGANPVPRDPAALVGPPDRAQGEAVGWGERRQPVTSPREPWSPWLPSNSGVVPRLTCNSAQKSPLKTE